MCNLFMQIRKNKKGINIISLIIIFVVLVIIIGITIVVINSFEAVASRDVALKVVLPEDGEKYIQSSSEDVKKIKHSVTFDYKDVNGIDKRTIMYIDNNQTIQEYLDISGEKLPKSTEWMPKIELNTPMFSNTLYKEVER